eukprot:CAMPEP_0176444966 /NCGR_PEP_ID=MMETSP0127-20121128/23396_1 /TAXON_ID=938130 /ORGANISM="Platyophrya macrostoma, Strain WH" /LENGTH=188 /DNA_ID=CAMNT_0017830613 /DNA_START=47 /DNA_END=610 /DNA_ORIENTATION=+
MTESTLYVMASCPFCWRVWTVAIASGVKLHSKFLTLEEVRGDEYKKINPAQKVPALQTKEGFLFESNAILRYLARENPSSGLYGSNPYEEALVDQWLDWISNEFTGHIQQFIRPVFGSNTFDKDAHKTAMEGAVKALKTLEAHFKTNKYFVGGSITLPDFALGTIMRYPMMLNWEEGFRKAYPNVLRW